MTPLQRQVAEEIATGHLEGLLSRREALRRLALLGVGTSAAVALVAACNQQRPTSAGPVPTEPIGWTGPRGELQGSWAPAANARGAVLVIHENKGLTDWVRSVAGRLAGIGYSALAIDLLSEEGGTGIFADPTAATAALGQVDRQRFTGDTRSGLDELQRRAPGLPLAAVGFCFGGGVVWQLLAAGEIRLAAAVPFYGTVPDYPNFAGSKDVAVLGIYGALDDRVTSTEPAARAALEAGGLVHELIVEPDAGHAFFNDTGERYSPTAAADAWDRLQDWFARYLS